MSITIECSDCGWKRTFDDEYQSEIAFDRHCDEEHPFTPEELKELTKDEEPAE